MKEYEALLQNQPVDVSEQFTSQHNHYFVGSAVWEFDPDHDSGSVSGNILWKGISLRQRVSYHQLTLEFEDYKVWRDTPSGEYDDQQSLPFSLSFVSPRCVRLRCAARMHGMSDEPSLMLTGPPPVDVTSWRSSGAGSSAVYDGPFGSVGIDRDPVRFEFRDASGRLLTRTHNLADARGWSTRCPPPCALYATPPTCTGT